MIDTKELRRLAQAATPGPWKLLPVGDKSKCFAVADINFLSVLTVVDECGTSFGAVYLDGDAKFIAAANPAAVSELLDRLEAAKSDAPYPGMSEAFEQHFSQSFTDREWRAESATWAAAWKAAKRHEAQAQPAPSAPEGWLRAIDEALIVAHIGMANADDTYAQAKSKLDTLISLHADIATDPAVNGGWKLVPTAESRHPGIHKMLNALHAVDNTPGASEWESYAAFLAATPEAKP